MCGFFFCDFSSHFAELREMLRSEKYLTQRREDGQKAQKGN